MLSINPNNVTEHNAPIAVFSLHSLVIIISVHWLLTTVSTESNTETSLTGVEIYRHTQTCGIDLQAGLLMFNTV